MNSWYPTHSLSFVFVDGTTATHLVMLLPETRRLDGSVGAATQAEYLAGDKPKWRMSRTGAWTWNGRETPEGKIVVKELSGAFVILPE